MKNESGEWFQGDADIAHTACKHFQTIFTSNEDWIDEEALHCIPIMINEDQNDTLQEMDEEMPSMEEIKHFGFSMSPYSAAGPDGINGKIFQSN